MSLRKLLGLLLFVPLVLPAASIQYQFGAYTFITPDFLPNLAPNPANFSFAVPASAMSACTMCDPQLGRYYFRGLIVSSTRAGATYYDIQGTDLPILTFFADYAANFLSSFGTLPSQGYGAIVISSTEANPTLMPEPATYALVTLALGLIWCGKRRWAALPRIES